MIDRQPGVMVFPDGSVVNIGLFVKKETSSSSHKQSSRPKPSSLSTSPTPMTGDTMSTSYSDIAYQSEPGAATIKGPASILDTLPFAPYPPRPSFTRLHIDLKMKVKDEVMNLAQNMAEYRQTCSLFAGLASDIFRTFRSLRRGRFPKGPESWTKEAANRWLAYQYGIKPLMSDIYNGIDEMSRVIPKPVYRRYGKRAQSTFRNVDLHPNPYVPIRTSQGQWSLRSRVTAVITPSPIKTAAEYGLTNPLLLAWELIPYSFVVDWMIPVGDTLASLDALVGVDTVFCENGSLLTMDQTFNTLGGGTGNYKYRRVERQGGFEFELASAFSYEPSSSFTAVLNGLALLRQLR